MTRRTRSDAGFTMLELVIAMSLMATVLAVALTGFQQLSDAADGASLTTDLNVNLRTTLNLMTRDLIGAGGRNIPVGGIPVPSGANSVPIVRPSLNDALTFPVSATLPAVTTGDGLGPVIGDDGATEEAEGVATDIISILMTDSTLPDLTSIDDGLAADGTSLTVNSDVPIDGDADGITAGDLLWLRRADAQTLVMVTGRSGPTIQFAGGDAMSLNQPNAESGSVMRLLDELEGSELPPTTQATRVQLITYYIDNTNAERPRLMRRVNMRPARTIGVVVENMQITYDLVDGVDNPANVASPANPNQIRKANLFLAGRSHREWRRTRDFLRTSVATQISLRSLSFVDRYNPDNEQ